MVVSEGAINNIMGGMENTAGVRLHSHRHKLKQRFDIIRKLGQGTYGKVQLAINKETGQEVAIKTIKKAKIETEQDLIRIRREIQIMSSVQHPQIIHIYEVFENREKMVLVMEYAAGGELYDYLSDRKVLSEEEARRVFRQVASAVYYCHKHKICHRDLKLENILLDLEGNAKIADFGLSNVFDEKHRLDTFCGSPLYASPEIVKGVPYVGPEVDCWSLGVLLYTLVYGAMPFDGSNFRRLVKQITQGDFYEPANPSNASELIRHMLTVTSTERATVEDICNHWWVNEGYKLSCLKEAEALASQTPVRLDLLLSLAPKHIDSEHMLIQPEEESQMPPPPEEIPVSDRVSPSHPALRSQSAGALPPSARTDLDALLEKKRQEAGEKKRRGDEPPVEKKKKKEGSMKKNKEEGEETKKVKKKEEPMETEISEKKKSVKKKEESSEINDKPEKKKNIKKRDSSVERSVKEKSVEKKTSKKGDASEREPKPERKRLVRKKDVPKSEDSNSLESTNSILKPPQRSSPTSSQSSSENLRLQLKERTPHPQETILKPTGRTPSPSPSTDATLRASDSSVVSRLSEGSSKIQEKPSTTPTVPKLDEEEHDIDTEKILQETAAKIERVEAAMAAERVEADLASESREGAKEDREDKALSPSKDSSASGSAKSSRYSSQVTTPTRSRTVSESSTEARPSRSERRQSKIFSKAAIFDNVVSSKSPPTSTERRKKVSRPGGLNMSDLAKKFEEKPSTFSTEKKSGNKVVSPFKVSDARKAFESKGSSDSSQPQSPIWKSSASSGGESLPTSPTRGNSLSNTRSGSLSSVPSGSTSLSKSGSRTEPPLESSVNEVPKGISPPRQVLRESPKKEIRTKDVLSLKKEKSPAMSETKKERSPLKDKENVQPSTGRATPVTTLSYKKEEITQPKDRIITTKPSSKESLSKPKEPLSRPKEPISKSKEPISKPKEIITRSKPESVTIQSSQTKSPEVVKVPEEARTRQIPIRIDSSDSSDSESEAEKLLRLLSEKREKLEMAKVEKLRKVSQANADAVPIAMSSIKEEFRTPARQTGKTPPETPVDVKFATLPRGFKNKNTPDRPYLSRGASSQASSFDEPKLADPLRKKTEMEIILNHQTRPPDPPSTRSSYAEIRIGAPKDTAKVAPQPEYRTEAQRTIGGVSSPPPRPPGGGEPHLQRARRERIIPIMLEDDDEDERSSTGTADTRSTLSSSSGRSNNTQGQHRMNLGSMGSRIDNQGPSSNPEPIRKSRRERIIPIAVEGEGLITPDPQERSNSKGYFDKPMSSSSFSEGLESQQRSTPTRGHGQPPIPPHTTEDRSRRPRRNNSRGRPFFVDRSESFSSAGEDEEDDEEDGFEILTAENLFSTLLSRVRSLTRKMTSDDPRLRRISPGILNHPEFSSSSGPNSGFWSSLYSRDSPARRISDSFARSGRGGDDDPFNHPIFNRSLSRDPSDADSVFSEPSSASNFSTLPRGWRNRRTGAESVISEPISGNSARRPFYSRTLSRDLHYNNATGEFERQQRPMRTSLTSLSSPHTRREGGSQPMDRVAAVYGTLRPSASNRRPYSVVETSSGETLGRVGGQSEHRSQGFGAQVGFPAKQLSVVSPSNKTIPQQIRNLVNELGNSKELRELQSQKSQVPLATSNTTSAVQLQASPQQPIKSNSVVTLIPKGQEEKIPKLANQMNGIMEQYLIRDKDNASSKNVNGLYKSLMQSKEEQAESVLINVNSKKNDLFDPHKRQLVARIEVGKPTSSVRVVIPKKISIPELERQNSKSPTAMQTLTSQQPATTVNEGKNSLTVQPYRKGKSEDLRMAIDQANICHNEEVKKNIIGRPYCRSKSRDIAPTIEAATEKLVVSGMPRRISPFEAYRQSKSKELGITIDQLTNSQPCDLDKVIEKERAKSPFARAKTSIECKVARAKSPVERMVSPPRLIKQIDDKTCIEGMQSDGSLESTIPVQQKEENRDPDKPRSMYKLFTSKFTRSLSNVGEEAPATDSSVKSKRLEEESVDKEDKFKLKRPSKFMKPKTEKSSSKTNLTDGKEDDIEKRPVKRLSEALNKFLGRRTDEQSKLKPEKSTSTSFIQENRMLQKPKLASASHDHLEQISENGICNHQRKGSHTLASATKDLCNHLSQIESNMTSRIDNLVSLPQEIRNVQGSFSQKKPKTMDQGNEPIQANGHIPNENNRKVSYGRQLSNDKFNARSVTPIESGDSSCLDDLREGDDESVMDRITRKSYYTRFNEKKKPLMRRIDSMESIDQQLAAAKARLLNEEKATRLERDSLSPTKLSASRTQQSISPPPWNGVTKRESRKYYGPRTTSLPPEESLMIYIPQSPPIKQLPGDYSKSHLQSPPPHTICDPISPSERMCASAYETTSPLVDSNHKRLSNIQDNIPMYHTLQYTKSSNHDTDSPMIVNSLTSPYQNLENRPKELKQRKVSKPETLKNIEKSPNSEQLQNGNIASTQILSKNVRRVPSQELSEIKIIPTKETTNSLISAREELNKRLTPLTKLASSAPQSSESTTATAKPYRRTVTSARLGGISASDSATRTPVTYKRTKTMDLPTTDSRIKPSDFRKLLHEPAKRTNSASTNDRTTDECQQSGRIAPPFGGQAILRRTSFYRY